MFEKIDEICSKIDKALARLKFSIINYQANKQKFVLILVIFVFLLFPLLGSSGWKDYKRNREIENFGEIATAKIIDIIDNKDVEKKYVISYIVDNTKYTSEEEFLYIDDYSNVSINDEFIIYYNVDKPYEFYFEGQKTISPKIEFDPLVCLISIIIIAAVIASYVQMKARAVNMEGKKLWYENE